MKIVWRQFREYSGPAIVGTKTIKPPSGERINYVLDRHHWLTTKVETNATLGTIVMYDGTVVTAGPDQFILVFPRELEAEDYDAEDDQGELPALLRRMEVVPGLKAPVKSLWEAFAQEGWYVSQDRGRLRYLTDSRVRVKDKDLEVRAGDLVHGSVLREGITPLHGQVPATGAHWDKAARWAVLFHELFSHPDGVLTQLEFGKEHLLKTYVRHGVHVEFFNRSPSAVQVSHIGLECDLAFAVWYCNSVNAPAIAKKCLDRVKPQWLADRRGFAKALIRVLGTSTFGRWNASYANGRYQRTRKYAMESGLWPPELFSGASAVMPARL